MIITEQEAGSSGLPGESPGGFGLPSQQYVDMNAFRTSGDFTYEDETFNNLPIEVRDIIETYDIGRKKFDYHLLRQAENGSFDGSAVLENGAQKLPTYEYVGIKYGPGKYRLRIMSRKSVNDTDPDGKQPGRIKAYDTEFIIDESYQNNHEEYIINAQMKSIERKKAIIERQKIKSHFDTSVTSLDPVKPAEQDIMGQMKAMMELLQGQKKPDTDWMKVIALVSAAVTPIVTALITRQPAAQVTQQPHDNNFEKIMMIMLASEKEKSKEMLELAKQTMKPVDPMGEMNKLMGVLGGIVDLKQIGMQKEEEEDTVTKILGMVEKSLPMIMMFAAMPKGSPQQNAGVAMVQNIPEVQEVMESPDKFIDTVNALDGKFGCKSTDMIIKTMGAQRPVECNANYSNPAYADPAPQQETSAGGERPAPVETEAQISG